MRKVPLFVVVVAACGAAAMMALAPNRGGSQPADQYLTDGGPAGRTPFAGTFLVKLDGLPPDTNLATFQMHRDGTVWAVQQWGWQGNGGLVDFVGPHIGSWTQTGPHQVTMVTLLFAWENPGGLPTDVTRVTHIVDFDKTHNYCTAFVTQRSYNTALGQDPLDPNQGTLLPGILTWTGHRLIP